MYNVISYLKLHCIQYQVKILVYVRNLHSKIMIRTCLWWLLIFFGEQLFAQNIGRQQLVDSMAVGYMRIADKQSVLYYGTEQEAHPRTTNHPYLKESSYAKGRLSYCQVMYPEVLLRLDLSRNELIVMSPDHRNIVLFPENVDFVELHDRYIIYFHSDSSPGSPSSGYYILLYSGKCRVLEKQTNTLNRKETGSRVSESYFSLSVNYYLYKDGYYHKIKNKRALLKVLSPYKRELKRFISDNHLRCKRDAEKFIVLTVSEYEKLSSSL